MNQSQGRSHKVTMNYSDEYGKGKTKRSISEASGLVKQ